MMSAEDRIRVCAENPCYWKYGGRPVLLLGGSVEDNLFQIPDIEEHLDLLDSVGGNYVRCTMSCRDEGDVWPFARHGELYDLHLWNEEFWRRFARFLELAAKRDIIVQIEFWATFDYYQDNWLRNPFNPALNVNYSTETTRLVPDWNHHPAHMVQPFFFSPPKLNNDQLLLRYQQAFVRRVMDFALPYGNVLYCLDNETSAEPEWAWYWGRFARDEAARRGVEIEITEMWDDWDLRGKQHRPTYERPDLFSYVDVSQNNWQAGQIHYDRILWMREQFGVLHKARRDGFLPSTPQNNALNHRQAHAFCGCHDFVQQPQLLHSGSGPRPMNNVKVYGLSRPRAPLQVPLSLDRFWQNIFGGCASTRFHRPDSGLGLGHTAQKMLRAARIFTDAFDLFRCSPRPALLSERSENGAYCLAEPGCVYALYFPTKGKVALRAVGGPFSLRWFDPESASFGPAKSVSGGTLRLQTPDAEQIWLALLEAESS